MPYVEGKNVGFFKIKRQIYTDQGEKKSIKDKGAVISKFDRKTGEMGAKLDLTDMVDMNLNMVADTMQVHLFLLSSAEVAKDAKALGKDAAFIGKLVVRFKHCFEEKMVNDW